MSLMDDIRAQMRKAAGPVTPAEIAEALDANAAAVRGAMYQAARQGVGIERHDDGTYSADPNWKPVRGAGDEPATAPATKHEKKPTREAKPRKKPGRKLGRKPAANPKAARSRRAPARVSAGASDIPARRVLAALVDAVYASGVAIAGDLRDAMREAAKFALPLPL